MTETSSGTDKTRGTDHELPAEPAEAPHQVTRRTVLQGAFMGALAVPALRGLVGNSIARSLVAARPAGQAQQVAKRSGTLQVANLAEPNFIDPAYALEVEEFAVVRNVYDGLLQWNVAESKLVPALATSWASNANATEWTFQLRPGVTFQDGTPFNSSAMKATFTHYLPGSWGFLLGGLTKVDDSNPQVLKVTFSAPNPDFARNLTFIKAMPPSLIGAKAAAKRAVGTGAFQWGEWVHGQKITLTASDNYWDKPEPYLDGVDLITVTDETARVNGLESGSLNLIMRVDPHDLPSLAAELEGRPVGRPELAGTPPHVPVRPADHQRPSCASGHRLRRGPSHDRKGRPAWTRHRCPLSDPDRLLRPHNADYRLLLRPGQVQGPPEGSRLFEGPYPQDGDRFPGLCPGRRSDGGAIGPGGDQCRLRR